MQSADVLDNPEQRAAIDRGGMSRSIISFPFQLEKGWELSKELALGRTPASPVSCIISGMGGSAIGGDIFGDIMRALSSFRVDINRTYSVPRFATRETLHIAISYSGNTEETLASFRDGLQRGVPSIGMSSGGQLESICREESVPFLKIPQGEQPRAALGYMLSGLLGIASRLGIYDFSSSIMGAVQSARTAAASVSPDVPSSRNPAKSLAIWLQGFTPVIISTPEIYSAAERMKTQFNENAKIFAWTMTIPEANHNDWVPVQLDQTANRYRAVLLETLSEEALLRRRMNVVEELIAGRIAVRKIGAEGHGILDQLLRYIMVGDMASYYLALLNSTDPSPVEPLLSLKRELSSRTQ